VAGFALYRHGRALLVLSETVLVLSETVLVLSETVLVLVIESNLLYCYVRSVHDLPLTTSECN
jgi:hypothetical protein